jgi:hypothetical protein
MKLKQSAVSGVAGDDLAMVDTDTALIKNSHNEW